MTAVERRFLAGFREVDSGSAGLIQKDDGTIWVVNPDGSETQLPGGGGSAVQVGSGTPVGSVTPSGIGAQYLDSDTDTLYVATGVTSADWAATGGGSSAFGTSYLVNASATTATLGVQAPVEFDVPADISVGSDITVSGDGLTLTLHADGWYSVMLYGEFAATASDTNGYVNLRLGGSSTATDAVLSEGQQRNQMWVDGALAVTPTICQTWPALNYKSGDTIQMLASVEIEAGSGDVQLTNGQITIVRMA